jgi:Tfp pilus assembly pilus retraction ATPase PilT
MQTLESHLSDLVARGDVALEDARAAGDRPDDVRTFVGAAP